MILSDTEKKRHNRAVMAVKRKELDEKFGKSIFTVLDSNENNTQSYLAGGNINRREALKRIPLSQLLQGSSSLSAAKTRPECLSDEEWEKVQDETPYKDTGSPSIEGTKYAEAIYEETPEEEDVDDLTIWDLL